MSFMPPELVSLEDLKLTQPQKRALVGIALAVATIAAVVGFGFGKYSSPQKLVEHTKVVHDQVTVTSSATSTTAADAGATTTEKTVDKTTVETRHPDGTVVVEHRDVVAAAKVVEKVVEKRVDVVHEQVVEKKVFVDREKLVVSNPPQWRAGLELGVANRDPTVPIAGALSGGNPIVSRVPFLVRGRASRRIVGPIWAGAWADTSVAGGISLEVEF